MYKIDFEVVRTLPLTKPLHYAGEEVTALQFREPEAELLDVLERMRKGKKPQSDSMVVLAWMTGVGIPSLRRLKWGDTQAALEIVAELTDQDFDTVPTAATTEPWDDDDDGALGKTEGSA